VAATPSSASAAAPTPQGTARHETSRGEAPPDSPTRRRRHGAQSGRPFDDRCDDFVKRPDKHETIDEAQKITGDSGAHAAVVKEMLLNNFVLCERSAVFKARQILRG